MLSTDKIGKKIGIFGGAFDPPHIGHMQAIQAILPSGVVDEIWVVPAGKRIEKAMFASAKDRMAMCSLMVKDCFGDDTRVRVKDFQAASEGFSFTVDLLHALEAAYPRYEFWLVVGMDVVPDIQYWKEGERLWHGARFIIVERPGVKPVLTLPPKHIIIKRNVECSGTMLRSMLKDGRAVEPYLSSKVLLHIKKHGLYY